jgi:cytochrome d ubiquinol oxidase subunit I
MQTPTGFSIGPDGRFLPEDWWAIVFNPSFPLRYLHTITGAYLTTAMIVGAVGAFHVLRNGANARARIMFSMAMWMAAAVAPAQAVFGDLQGLWALHYQPQKVAAMEGHWETYRGAPLILFGMPDMEREETRLALQIPHLGSLILRHEWNGEILGLKAFPRDARPTNVPLVFWSFRIMVAIGLLMIALGLVSLWLRWRGTLYRREWFLRWAVAMGPSGLVAVTFGWITTEAGRQPFTVYGLMRTADSVSPIAAPAVLTSLAMFVVVYFVVFGAGIWYLFRLFRHPPEAHEAGPPRGEPIRTAGITPAPAIDPRAVPSTTQSAAQPAALGE